SRGPGSPEAAPVPSPDLEGLCQAYAAGAGGGPGAAMAATAFQALARAAGGEDQVPAYCEQLLPGERKLKDPKNPGDPGAPGGGDPDQGGPPPGPGGGNQGRPGSRADTG
ncbi:MAG TPA: hypothetical protein VID07_06945, partial [Actinomycetes bacterium]